MGELIVYLNGKYMEESKATLSIYDRGFLYGDAVYDVCRTFDHRPFRLKEHIDRLYRSLRFTQIDPRLTPQEMYDITLEVLKYNEKKLAPNDDFLLVQRVSRGEGLYMSRYPTTGPTVLIACHPIDFRAFAHNYSEGVHLITATTRHLPPTCLDPRLKVQSRIINVLADLEVKAVDPSAYALMLDIRGFLTEGPTFNFFMAKGGKLFTPRVTDVLEGITRHTVLELARELGIEKYETDLTPYDLYNADEAIITSSDFAILPVSKLNKKPLEGPIPGPITKQLLLALSRLVGVDIVRQAENHVNQGCPLTQEMCQEFGRQNSITGEGS